MQNINDFSLNRELDPEIQNKILTKYIDDFYNSKNFSEQIVYLSKIFEIPKGVFEQDVKNYLITNFKNSMGNFFHILIFILH